MNFRALLLVCLVLMPFAAFAQVTVSGTVRESSGEPIIGATVIEKGTNNGAATDIDGKFSFKASNDKATLVVSYVGFESQTIALAGRKSIVVTLKTDDELLDDVVVVGYGTMKKKLVTGATVQVKGEDIAKLNTTNALTAMQATTPGVQITQSSSQPGKGFKVNIRGIGTMGNSSPLLIIDGVNAGTADDGLNGLNPNDIERIDVLKDAASAAIYGARAANGVILVTTKQGKAGQISVQYDGYVGVSNPYKVPAMVNAQDYMSLINESYFNTYGKQTPWSSLVPQSILDKVADGWTGTDWFDAYRNKNAIQTSHAATISGGTDRAKFSLSVNYSDNEGIFGRDNASDYKRYGGRVNSDYVLLRNSKGRDIITVGENISYWYQASHDLAEGNGYWNIMQGAYNGNPLVEPFNEDGTVTSYSQNHAGYSDLIYSNPLNGFLNGMFSSVNRNRNFGVGATFYTEIEPIKGLKYRGQINTGYSANNSHSHSMPYSVSYTSSGGNYGVNQAGYQSSSMSIENTLTYALPTLGKHNIDVMIGQSYEKSNWSQGLSMSASDGQDAVNSLVTKGFDYAIMSNMSNLTGYSGYDNPMQGSIASYFGRANWNYDEKYMATVTVRRDGSSNFAKGNRWGTFPSASVGWVITNEKFMESVTPVMDFFKIRASWGQNGNCNVGNYYYLSNIGFSPTDYADYGYKFSSDMNYTVGGPKNYTTGAYAQNVPNEDITWETSEQINVGFDATFLNGRLGVNFDWYKKTTKDWLVEAPLNMITGYEKAAYINGGDIENKGVELALSWKDRIGKDFNYHVNVNGAWNKNKVTRLANASGKITGQTSAIFQNSSYVSVVEVGQPIAYFSGMEYDGIWQNQAEIDAARAAGQAVLADAQPGDCKWIDYNGDGQITLDEDRHKIGDPNPDFTLGVNLGFDYKGFDFSVQGAGQFGMQIMQCYRTGMLDNLFVQYSTDAFDRWHGEGTSNTMPILKQGSENNQWVSNRYMQNADFFKIQNITLGYDFAKNLWKNDYFSQLRLYVQAQNLFTFTKYTGVDPEVGSSGGKDSWARGVDVGLYPTARTFLVGVSVKFADSKAKPAKEVVAPQIIEKEVIKEVIKEVPVIKEVVKETKGNPNNYVVTFEVDKSVIANPAELDGIKAGDTVEIEAYASPEGGADYNLALSQRRADAVAEYLRAKGVKVVSIAAKGADTEHANRIVIVTVK